MSYGTRPGNGKTFKELMLDKFDYDMSRLHFTGFLSYHNYLKVLQASSAHVYLSYPFVLSWSMLEAMSSGCVVVASNTSPVTEVIQDGHNGYLVEFFSPVEIVDNIIKILDQGTNVVDIGRNARKTVRDNYSLPSCRDKQLAYLGRFLN